MEIKVELTQEQLCGVHYVLQYVVNPPIIKENEQITEQNKDKPVEEQAALKDLHTEESYIQFVVGMATDDYYKQLLKFKEDNALKMFNSLSDQEKLALVAQLQIPDVVK
jgi:hypothetical protein